MKVWVGVSLIHSRPNMTSVNRTGSVSRSGRCDTIAVGMLLKRWDRKGERAGHLAIK